MGEIMNIEQAKAMAMEMQRKAIFSVMIWNYSGGGRKIVKFDDFTYSISGFLTCRYGSLDIDRNRYWLNKLVKIGFLQKHQSRKGGSSRYLFPREVCDQIAAAAIAHYQSLGYSQDEIRQKVAADGDGAKHE